MAELTLGHLRLLSDLGNPFVSTRSKNAQEGSRASIDLMTAAAVCAFDWRDSVKYLSKWYVQPLIWLWAWRVKRSDCNVITETQRFLHFLNENLKIPKVKKAGTGQPMKAAFHDRLYIMLVEQFNHDPVKAWDVPVREAINLWVARAEREGGLTFWSDEELEHWEAHKKAEKEYLENLEKEKAA